MANEEELINDGLLDSDEVLTGFISAATFTNKPVQYTVVDGMAIFEGCIALDTAERMAQRTAQVRAELGSASVEGIAHAVVISGDQYRWPNARMPYSIDAALPNQQRVTDAINHWTQNTNVGFVERTAANASQHPNYVHFRPATGCWSQVGMRGGKQEIGLANGCGLGATIHEIGHAFSLWHEQSREDRDQFVIIHWQNITAGREHNFNQHINDGDDVGAYDYGSIMHYGQFAFSKNNQPTITPTQAGAVIGQRNGLSQGDINAIHSIYNTWHTNRLVTRTFASTGSKNAWAAIEGLGWRKIKADSPDGVTNMFVALCEARAAGRRVNVLADGSDISTMYLN